MNKSLKTLQADFLTAMLRDDPARMAGELQGPVSDQGMLGIYRNNIAGAHAGALGLTYPVIRALVGARFFHALCWEFTRAHPPQSGNMDEYGEKLADFLEMFPPARSLPYLPDMARFEWLYQAVLDGEEHTALTEQALAGIAPQQFGTLRFTLHPGCRFFTSDYPIDRIWLAHQEDAADEVIDLGSGSVILLLNKPGRTVHYVTLSGAELAFLQCLQAGSTLLDAFEAAEKADPEFDLAFYINKHMLNGTFSALTRE